MRIEVKNAILEKVVAKRSGVSAKTGNPWEQETLLINAKNGQYDNKMVVTLFGIDKIKEFHQIADNGNFDADIYIDVNEWQDKFYNDLSMGSFRPAYANQPVKEIPVGIGAVPSKELEYREDDLPFG